MKKILHTLALLTLLAAFCLTACSASEPLTKDDLDAAVQSIHDEYGILFDIFDYDEDTALTQDMLDGVVCCMEYIAAKELYEPLLDEDTTSDGGATITRTRYTIMPLASLTPKGAALIYVTATATIDSDSGQVLSIDKTSAYQLGLALDLDEWETEAITLVPDTMANGHVTLNVQGSICFTFKDPKTGRGYTSTSDIDKDVVIDFT